MPPLRSSSICGIDECGVRTTNRKATGVVPLGAKASAGRPLDLREVVQQWRWDEPLEHWVAQARGGDKADGPWDREDGNRKFGQAL
jgi:hypothetical protein